MPDPEKFPDAATVRTAWTTQEETIRLFVQSSGDTLDRVVTYRTLAGEEVQSVFSHMLQHLVNHASYHRGQITTMLRQLGAPAPKPQDLIRFYREKMPAVR